MAERVGFEPTVPVKGQQFSRLPRSTALPPLHYNNCNNLMAVERVTVLNIIFLGLIFKC